MFRNIVLFFIVVPLLELYLLIKVGGVIGPGITVALVILTAILGAFLLRQQGFSTLRRVQESLAKGIMPAAELIEGLILLISGAFLLTPGFFTDTLGFLGLIPGLRRRLSQFLLSRVQAEAVSFAEVRRADVRQSHTIEGDFHRDP